MKYTLVIFAFVIPFWSLVQNHQISCSYETEFLLILWTYSDASYLQNSMAVPSLWTHPNFHVKLHVVINKCDKMYLIDTCFNIGENISWWSITSIFLIKNHLALVGEQIFGIMRFFWTDVWDRSLVGYGLVCWWYAGWNDFIGLNWCVILVGFVGSGIHFYHADFWSGSWVREIFLLSPQDGAKLWETARRIWMWIK